MREYKKNGIRQSLIVFRENVAKKSMVDWPKFRNSVSMKPSFRRCKTKANWRILNR
jgi:hypothetical protein